MVQAQSIESQVLNVSSLRALADLGLMPNSWKGVLRWFENEREIELDLVGVEGLLLPEGFWVRGNLHVDKVCAPWLPSGLRVRKDLYISGHGNFDLPPGLEINGDVYVTGSGFDRMPEDSVVKGRIMWYCDLL